MSRKSFVSGAIILMLAGLIVRVMGFVYRIYLSNLIGAEGMGLFQLISPVYSLVILTLTSGISIAVSKMVAEELAKNHPANLSRITGCALGLILVSGILVSVIIFFNTGFISNTLLKDERTYYSLLVLIPCIPVIAAASVLKGYFYGIQEVMPTALSQIVEQIVRIAIVMLTAGYFVNQGLAYACALATVGMVLGEISNLLVLYVIYAVRKKKTSKLSAQGTLRKRRIFEQLLSLSLPISANRFIASIMFSVEYILIPRRLLAGGLDYSHSMEVYGKLTGMAMPLIFFPSLVTSSIAVTLVPAISEALSLKNYKSVNYRISKSVQIAFILGFIFTAIFLSYPDEISNLLYRKENIGGILYMLSFTCVFMYLQQTLLGVLNGLGKQGVSLRNMLIGSALRIGFVYFLIPRYGLQAYIWGIILSSVCVCILNLYVVIKTTGMHLDFRNWIMKPGFVSLVMFATSKYAYAFMEIFFARTLVVTALTIVVEVLVALLLMSVIGALDIGEMLRLFGFKKQRKIKKNLV